MATLKKKKLFWASKRGSAAGAKAKAGKNALLHRRIENRLAPVAAETGAIPRLPRVSYPSGGEIKSVPKKGIQFLTPQVR